MQTLMLTSDSTLNVSTLLQIGLMTRNQLSVPGSDQDEKTVNYRPTIVKKRNKDRLLNTKWHCNFCIQCKHQIQQHIFYKFHHFLPIIIAILHLHIISLSSR